MEKKSSNIEKGYNVYENEEFSEVQGYALGIRHVQVALYFFLALVATSQKSYFSVAIVAMTDPSTSPNPDVPTYDWDDKSVILSSYLWGYCSQVVTGQLAKKYGEKWILFTSILLNGLITIAIPFSAEHFGSTGIIVCRVVQGILLGVVFPSLHGLMGQWIPLEERSRLGSIAYAALAPAYLSTTWIGWPLAFYVVGSSCFLWCILWALLGSNSPDVHPKISETEKKYIMSSLGHQENAEVLETPWMAMIKSPPCWALMIAGIGTVWMANLFLTENPTYMTSVLGLDIENTSLLNTIHSIMAPVVTFLSAIVADKLIVNQTLSSTSVRRIFQVLGAIVPGVLCCFIGFIPKEQVALSVTVITVTMITQSLVINSTTVNYMDLSPKFAGVLLGVINGISQAISLFAPLLVQFIVTDETNILQWRTIFTVAGSLLAASALVFIWLVSGEKQWWNEGKNGKKIFEEK